jgi:hypothetical protein
VRNLAAIPQICQSYQIMLEASISATSELNPHKIESKRETTIPLALMSCFVALKM